MRQFLSYSILLVSLVAFSQSGQDNPNIIWIVADDLGTDLGCYGEELVKTPNLDGLAEQSVIYTNLHTVTAVCSPSRSALITGMYPTSINAHQHRIRFKEQLPDSILPISKYFQEAGYYVTNSNGKRTKKGKTDYNFQFRFEELYDGINWNERAEGQPFFAQLQIFLPHRPFHTDELNPIDPDKIELPPYYPDHPIIRKDWTLYLETIQHVDEQVGDIIKMLKNEGVLDNTIIFFFGDQGRPHLRAKQWLYDPGTNTPLMVRWPDGRDAGTVSDQLVSNIDISVASLALAGIPIPSHIQGLDFLNRNLEERTHLFTMRDRRDETVDRIRAIRTKDFKYIRNFHPDRPYTQFNAYKKFRYPALTLMQVMHKNGELDEIQSLFMVNKKPKEELFDLKADPYEVNNLAWGKYHQSVLRELRAAMDECLNQYDKATYPESANEIQANIDFMEKRFKKNMESIGLSVDTSDEDFLIYWERKLLNNSISK